MDDGTLPSLEPPPEVTAAVFAEWRNARRGAAPAEAMTNPFWVWMVETGHGPYPVNDHFGGPPSSTAGPGWTNDRYGQSTTVMPDGRTVLIGGEHEDYYDADFFIYNDVIVRHPDGRVDILGYDEVSFPPTDFHTATRVGDQIVLIGNLGYIDRRQPGETQVLVLDTASWNMRSMPTTGKRPGAISRHSAERVSGDAIRVRGGFLDNGSDRRVLLENTDDWELDIATWSWRQVTDRQWSQWQLARADGRPSGLWTHRTHQLAFGADSATVDLTDLYTPPVAHRAGERSPEEFNVFRVIVDDVTLRFVEDMGGPRLIVEGAVAPSTIETVIADVRTKLAAIDDADYVATRLD